MSKGLLTLLLMVLLPGAGAGQEALVLSGGGSRGLAHAGAIQGLEERGYDPDLVVGTSMGALVGALYAAGYEPGEIRDQILAIDWGGIFAPTPVIVGPDRQALYPVVNFDFTFEELRVARGLIAQWRINRTLSHLLFDANARARSDFDRLPRAYRAVAADLRTGEEVVLSEGDLARAARASMAVPGVFGPVVWDGRVLVDGGIVNNLPTDVARALGANRVIAVDVGRPAEEFRDRTPLAILERAIDLLQENTQRDSVAPDVLIQPDVNQGASRSVFPADPTVLIQRGLEAARRDLPVAAGDQGAGERPLPPPPERLTSILIEAPDSALARLARVMLAGAATGVYDPAAVLNGVDRLYTTGLFEAVWPQVVEDPETGDAALLVRLDAPPETSLAAGAGYDNDRGARAWVSLLRASSAAYVPATLSASGSIDGIDRWLSLSTRLQLLTRLDLAVSGGVHAREQDVRFFLEDGVGNLDVVRLGGWASVERPHVLRDQLAAAAMRAEWVSVQQGPSGLSFGPMVRIARLNPEALIVGEPFLLEAEHRWGDIGYSTALLRGSKAWRRPRARVAAVGDLRWSSRSAPPDVQPALGDEHAMPGLRWGADRGNVRALFGADAAYALLGGHARLRVRTGSVAAEIADLEAAPWVTGAEIAGVWTSPIGIAEVGFGGNTDGGSRLHISIGRSF